MTFLKANTIVVKDRIAQYDFKENHDFVVFPNFGENPKGLENKGGRPSKHYFLTLDIAKELAMVERNEKGKQARQYFIECERRAKETLSHPQIPQSLPEALRLAAQLAEEKNQWKEKAEVNQTKAIVHDQLASLRDTFGVRSAANLLGIGQKELSQWLLTNSWIYEQAGKKHVYAERKKQEYMASKFHPYTRSNGEEGVSETPRITVKGLERLAVIFHVKLDPEMVEALKGRKD